MSVFHSPVEIVCDQFGVGQGNDAAIKDSGKADLQRKASAGLTREEGVQFADFATENPGVLAEKQRNFVTPLRSYMKLCRST